MGGMCLGSLVLPRVIGTRSHPLRVFACLEGAIGVFGVVLWHFLPSAASAYVALGNEQLVARVVFAAVCLLPPTMAMGATLPAIARAVDTTPSGVSWIGLFYSSNLIGAVAGTLVAGFYLLRVFDAAVATYAAAALNVLVATIAWGVARRSPALAAPATVQPELTRTRRSALVYIAIAGSGLTALSAEVLWTRLLALSFGATVYTFSLILAAFLIGLGAGSALGGFLDRQPGFRARVALAWAQMLLPIAMAWGAFVLTQVIPFWPITEAVRAEPVLTFQLDFLRALLVVLPAALLWGASVPLALASVAIPGVDSGRLVAGIYAANTVGAIAGALGTSLLLAGWLGTQHAQQLLMVCALVSGLIALRSVDGAGGMAPWVAVAAGAGLLLSVQPVPGALIAYGRLSAERSGIAAGTADAILYTGEGLHEFVAVSRGPADSLIYHAGGKAQASTVVQDMRLQVLLAHLSHLVARRPANVLVVGCGAGVTAGALSTGPGVERLTIAEIEPLVPRVASEYFATYNYGVIGNPRVSVRIDDGRHVLATTNETFDVITTDVLDPWVKGVASLYTREFFELAKRRLRPGGVVTQFVQLYQSSTDVVKSEIATFVEAFPDAIVWSNPQQGQGYDLVLLGQVEPTRIDVDQLQTRLESPAYAAVAESLKSVGIQSAVDLLSTYAGSGRDLEPWLRDADINRDRDLRLQYLAGLGLNRDERGPIYLEMQAYTKFPADLFTGSLATLESLKAAIERSLPK